MKSAAFLVPLLLLFVPTGAGAHEEDSGEESHHSHLLPGERAALRSKRYGAFEFRAAPYFSAVDQEFDGATPYKDAFGTAPLWAFGVEIDYQLLRIPHFGSLGPGVGFHYANRSGTADFTSSDDVSGHTQRLWIMPMYAAAVLRIDVLKTDYLVPLVPYAKLGFAVNLWEARDAGSLSKNGDEEGRGLELGWNAHLGLMLHLNPISNQASADMDASTGVNDAYLFAEWWFSRVNSFGQGMQVGTNTVCFGLAIEY